MSALARAGRMAASRQEQVGSIVTGLGEAGRESRERAGLFFRNLEGFLAGASSPSFGYDRRVLLDQGARAKPAWSQVEVAWEGLDGALRRLEEGMRDLATAW